MKSNRLVIFIMETKTNTQTTKDLLKTLKDAEEDFEFYPTSKEMIKPIFDNIEKSDINILDIGCGTCNFKKYYNEFSQEDYEIGSKKAKLEAEKEDPDPFIRSDRKIISKYYVIEKSKILLNGLDRETIVLGTDFENEMLIDKPVDIIFCNPPYSDYKKWMLKIISEGNCYDIYLVVPERWKDNKQIKDFLTKKELNYKILGSFDFLNAERQARAKVNIVHIIKKERDYGKLPLIEETAFDEWFDKTFQMSSKEEKKLNDYEREQKEKEKIKEQLICEPKEKAKVLIQLYEEESNKLLNNFKAICGLDIDILETIGVSKNSLKEAIKQKLINLKNLYWEMVFEEMEEITKRLTESSRDRMLNKFTELKSVDFTLSNIYSLVIWVIKNANQFYNDQLIYFYKELSKLENVKPYKSNLKLFDKEKWKYLKFSEKASHYTLDYRIICSNFLIGVNYSYGHMSSYNNKSRLNDFKAIFNNLGFEISYVENCRAFGVNYYAHDPKGNVMFEYKCYKNGNLHIKFNIEFTKALNVEVSRLLGWIKSKEDIKKEFCDEMAKGAEKYFKINHSVQIGNNLLLLNSNDED